MPPTSGGLACRCPGQRGKPWRVSRPVPVPRPLFTCCPLGVLLWFCLLLPRVSLLLGLPRCSGSGVSRPLLPGSSFRVVSVSLLSVFLLLGLAVPCLRLRLKLARLFLPLAAFLRSPAPLRPLSVPVPVCGLSGCLCPLGLVFPAFGPLALACASLALGGVPCSRGWPVRPAFFFWEKENPRPVISNPDRGFCQHQTMQAQKTARRR